MEVQDPIPIPLEEFREVATERYSAQVTLSENGREIKNYVAGLPFPEIDEKDPQVATKLVYNAVRRIVVDDVAAVKF